MQDGKNCPTCHWSPAQPGVSALWRQQQALLQDLRPWGWAPVPPRMGCAFFPRKGEAGGGVFGSSHPSWGGVDGWFEERFGAPAGMGSEAGSQPRACGMSWLQDQLFSAQKTKLVLKLLHIHPELSPTATTPLLAAVWLVRALSKHSPGSSRAKQRHPAEILLSLPQPRMPPCLGLCKVFLMAERSSSQACRVLVPPHTCDAHGGPITSPQEQDKGAQPQGTGLGCAPACTG